MPRVGADGDVVRRGGAVGDDGVGCAVAGAVEGVEVDVGGCQVGAGEVVDGDGVGAAQRADVEASMPSKSMVMAAMSRVRRTREPLAETSMCSAALEPLKSRRRCRPGPRRCRCRRPDPTGSGRRRARAARCRCLVAVDEVVAGAADEQVVAVAAARACRRRRRRRCVRCGERGDAVLAVDRVVAGEAADDEVLDGAVVDRPAPGANAATAVPFARDADRRRRRWCRCRRWCPRRRRRRR